MKKTSKKLISMSVFLCAVMCTLIFGFFMKDKASKAESGYEDTSTGYIYGYTLKDGYAEDVRIIGKNGVQNGKYLTPDKDEDGYKKEYTNIIVPDQIKDSGNTYKVRSIGESFYKEENLSGNFLIHIDLSGCTGLYSIGDSAFSGCTSLANISLIGCTGLYSIGDSAFSGCTSLANISLSGCTGLYSIGDSAFKGCNLSSLVPPYSVGYIGKDALAVSNANFIFAATNPNLVFDDTMTNVKTRIGYDHSTLKNFCDANSLGYTNFTKSAEQIVKAFKDHDKSFQFNLKYSTFSANDDVTINGEINPENVLFSTYVFAADYNLKGSDYAVKIQVPSATHYQFGGYFTEKNGNGTKVFDEKGNISISDLSLAKESGVIELYAKWTSNDYTVNYELNGGKMRNGQNITSFQTYNYDKDLILPVVERRGYTFKGWYDNVRLENGKYSQIDAHSAPTNANDKTFDMYAKWEANTYQAKFHMNEGSWKSYFVQDGYTKVDNNTYVSDYTYSESKSALEFSTDIERKGCDFLGWYNNKEYTGEALSGIPKDTIDNQNYYAKWNYHIYKITYSLGKAEESDRVHGFDGEKVDTYKVTDTVKLPSATWDAMEFNGWEVENIQNGSIDGVKIGDVITELPEQSTADLTLRAVWNAGTYKLTYETNGGTLSTDEKYAQTYKYGENALYPRDVRKVGYDFAGWYEDKDFSGERVECTQKTEWGDKTLYAKWNNQSYSYVLDYNGGVRKDGKEAEYTMTVYYGMSMNLPEIIKSGQKLTGWQLIGSNENTILQSTDLVEITGNQTLRAVWEDAIYDVYFDANGGVCDKKSQKAKNGATYGTFPTPTRAGYSFVGWYLNGKRYYGSEICQLTSDITLTAQWSKNSDTGEDKTYGSLQPGSTYENINAEKVDAAGAAKLAGWYRGPSTGQYYNRLNTDEKKVYAKIYNDFLGGDNIGENIKFRMTKTVNDSIGDLVKNACEAYRADHPETIWFWSSAIYYKNYGNNIYDVMIVPYCAYDADTQYSLAKTLKANAGYENFIKKTDISSKDLTAQKVVKIQKLIHKTFVYSVKDDEGKESNKVRDPAYSLLKSTKKRAVCVSYSNLFTIMCKYYDIPVTNVCGKVAAADKYKHMWNYVKLDGKWYMCDPTGTTYLNGSESSYYSTDKFKSKSMLSYLPMNKTGYVMRVTQKTGTYEMATSDYVYNQNVCVLVKGGTAKSVTIGTVAFGSVTAKVDSVKGNAFKGNKNLQKLVFKNGVRTVGSGAFSGCKKLKTVTVNSSTLTTVKKNAFKNCTALKTFKATKGVSFLEDSALSGCKSLKTVTLSKSTYTIGKNAFKNCKNLTTVTIKGKAISRINTGVFSGCKKLKRITLQKGISKMGKAFKGVPKKCVIKMPKSCKKKYKKLLKKAGYKGKIK